MDELDLEIKAIADITKALSQLEPDAVQRVLKYVTQRYQAKPVVTAINSFAEFHELFEAANPSSGPDKALVAAYWYQVILGHEDPDGFIINKELKNLGHQSNNITRDLDALMRRSPRLMLVRKEGSSKQARKRYKLTREGIRAVEKMVSAPKTSDDTDSR